MSHALKSFAGGTTIRVMRPMTDASDRAPRTPGNQAEPSGLRFAVSWSAITVTLRQPSRRTSALSASTPDEQDGRPAACSPSVSAAAVSVGPSHTASSPAADTLQKSVGVARELSRGAAPALGLGLSLIHI